MAEAIQVLRASKIGKGRRLLYHDVPLTSEKLRAVIDTAILQAGGLALPHDRRRRQARLRPARGGLRPAARPRTHHPGHLSPLAEDRLFRRHHPHGRPRAAPARRFGSCMTRFIEGQKLAFQQDASRRADGPSASNGPGVLRAGRLPDRQARRPHARLLPRHRPRRWAWKSTRRRAWGRIRRGCCRPARWSRSSLGSTTPNSAACGSRTWRWSPRLRHAT